MNSGIKFRFRLPRGDFNLEMDTEIPGHGVTAFFGRSGSGKTSLLRCLAGLESPPEAFLSVKGKIWHDSDKNVFVPPYQRAIGYVFQEGALFPKMTVQKNLLFGNQRTPKNLRKANFERVVRLLGLNMLLSRLPVFLSGGEKQRVAIGRALLNHPQLLLMDEPMASLDQTHKKEILPYLENLHKNFNIPILYITHDQEEMVRISNYLVIIDKGKITAQGEIGDILTRIDLPLARENEAASIIDAEVMEHDTTYYLTKLTFPGGDLFVNWLNRDKGSHLRLRILAKDVSVSLEYPQKSSIINILPAVVEDMQIHGRGRLMLRLNIRGIRILSRITQKSQHLLDLNIGDTVFAEIKSVALLV